MKLLACTILGFGKFKSVKLDFNSTLTCICEENGYGKTTLAAFLKAMFYGMDSSTKKSKFNDRMHYLPFDGGAYGGTVVFEFQGIRYRVKRTFDPSSAARDTFNLTADRESAPFLADPIGESIFGIDRESFERTIFITSQEIGLSSTDSIKTKLNNFVEGSNDDTNLVQALKKLEARAKEYSRKSDRVGLIYDEKAKAEKIRESIANRNTISGALAGKQDRLASMEASVMDLRKQISAAQTENTLRADWEHYDELSAAAAQAKDSINEIYARYPYGVPGIAEVTDAQNALSQYATQQAVLQKRSFTAEDEEAYNAYCREFPSGVPAQEYMSRLADDVHKVQEEDARIAAIASRTPTESEAALKKRFDGRCPDRTVPDTLAEHERQYKEADDACNSTPDMAETPASKPSAGGKYNIVLLIVAAVLLIAGIGVCFAQLIAGIILLVLGIVVLLLDGFLYLNRKSGHGSLGADSRMAELRQSRDDAANRIGAIIMPYGYSFEGGVLFGVNSFLRDLDAYGKYMEEESARQAEMLARKKSRDAVADALAQAFLRFGIAEETLSSSYGRLREDISAYRTLKSRKESSDTSEKATRDSMQRCWAKVCNFCSKYGLPVSGDDMKQVLDETEDDVRMLGGCIDSYNEAAGKANEFMARKNLAPRPDGASVDIDAVNARLTEIQGRCSTLALEIADDERELEAKDGLENDLSACNDKIAAYTANYNIILKTMDALKAADDRLKDKYANPISGSFDKYERALQKSTGERIYMTRDLNVRFEHAGMEKGEEYLSSGQRSACALCYRLAILDNMYSGEKPFLILDDPFSSMDSQHFASSKALLTDLSGSFQIIYLTCHESRMI